MNKQYFFAFFLGFAQIAFAQTQDTHTPTNRFELEVDPIAYALKGYSVHGIYVHERMRFDLGFFGIEQPEGYSGNEGFNTHTQGVGGKINFLLNRKQTWFAGIGGGYADNKVTLEENGEVGHVYNWSLGVHAGYRWFFLKKTALQGLYLAPWASLDYNMPVNTLHFEGKTYEVKRWSVFPTLHIGYRF